MKLIMESWRKFVNEAGQNLIGKEMDSSAGVQFAITDYFNADGSSLDNPHTISVHMNGEPLEGGFRRVIKELEGVEIFDPDDQETFTFTLENWRQMSPHAEDDDDLMWEIMKSGASPFLIGEWAKLQGMTATEVRFDDIRPDIAQAGGPDDYD